MEKEEISMNLRLLEYFIAVASNLSFSRAAENLHVAQSTLSQQIQQLEEICGAKLLNRNGRNISLTPAGMYLQEAASHLLEESNRVLREVGEIAEDESKQFYSLRVAFDKHLIEDDFLAGDFICAVQKLTELYQNKIGFYPIFIPVDLDEPHTSLMDELENNQVDFWLFGSENRVHHKDVHLEVVYDDSFGVMISPKHPMWRPDLSLQDLPDLINQTTLFLLQNRSRYTSSTLSSLVNQNLKPNIHYESEAVVNSFYVALGLGISIVPARSNGPILVDGQCVIPVPDSHFYTMAGYRKDRENPLLPALLDLLKRQAASHDAQKSS